ncbi:MAG: tetratricopeptide repeat protein [Bacteroidota bacterium]
MKKAFIYLSLLGMVLGFMAFDCSSAELTGAKLYINQKQYAKAKEALLKDVQKNPKSDEGYYLLGYLYGEEGDVSNMIDAFNKSVAISPKFEPQIKDYKKYTWQTSFNKGVGAFNVAVKTTKPDSMKIFFKKAIDLFNNAGLCEPDSTGAYENIVSAYLNMGDQEGAIPVLLKLTDMGKPAYAFAQLGQIYLINGSKMIDSYRASKNVADSAKAFEWYGKAIDVLKKGAAKYPSDSGILLQLGNAYYASDEIETAITSFKTLAEKMPTNKDIRYAYGVVLLKGKQYQESVKELTEAVKMDEKNTDAIYNLAAAYINWGNDLREVAVKSESGDKSYLQKFEAAIPYLEQYLTIKPNESRVWTSLYQVYANLGKKEKAEEAFKKAEQYK